MFDREAVSLAHDVCVLDCDHKRQKDWPGAQNHGYPRRRQNEKQRGQTQEQEKAAEEKSDDDEVENYFNQVYRCRFH
jgi:hypothetical protein